MFQSKRRRSAYFLNDKLDETKTNSLSLVPTTEQKLILSQHDQNSDTLINHDWSSAKASSVNVPSVYLGRL